MELKFRASAVGGLMTDPKSKTAKENKELSITAKTLIKDIWLQKLTGYREPVITKEMLKGLMCEADSRFMLDEVLPLPYLRMKNIVSYEDEFFTGTPDIVLSDLSTVEDIKSSWSIKTFEKIDGISKLYYAQGQVYMHLTGCKKYRLIYCLVPTPEVLISMDSYHASIKYYSIGKDEDGDKIQKEVENNHKLIESIPKDQRVKIYPFDYDPDYIKELIVRVNRARKYAKTLKLVPDANHVSNFKNIISQETALCGA